MSFYEKLPLVAQTKLIQDYVLSEVIPLGDPVFSGDLFGYNDFGGYSLLTRTGHWQDGWQIGCVGKPGQTILDPKSVNLKAAKFLNLSHHFEHKNPTEICRGPILELIEQISSMGFYPRRARISILKSGTKTILHSDGGMHDYMCRIHIPIFTSDDCYHRCLDYNLHMPADGSVYIIKVNLLHQVFNNSPINRYHIIMDCWDTKLVTKNCHYYRRIEELDKEAQLYRKAIDSIELTVDEIKHFERVTQQFMKSK